MPAAAHEAVLRHGSRASSRTVHVWVNIADTPEIATNA